MKKAKIEIKINVPNDFEMGDCKRCPYGRTSSKEVFYQQYEETTYCNLGFNDVSCPIETID